MFIAANTRRPATGGGVFELAQYFKMVFLEILPSAWNMSLHNMHTCVCVCACVRVCV